MPLHVQAPQDKPTTLNHPLAENQLQSTKGRALLNKGNWDCQYCMLVSY
ncbi:hypothetical protein [Streptococcus intermedius]|uniref:Uncharacterized protein n=1 Tax=Streptococcus intermedius TaxID=1338 RepID=A0AAD1C797_STRIT|nr:hypothetical protein [Streptococcus intermedius]BAW16478.1 hypothetical [Streptococcus intermedius]